MTLFRLPGFPRRGRVVGELQADRQRGLLEVLRQRRERVRLGDGPDRRLVVILVTGALGDDDALELTVARDLEDHRRLLAGQRVAVPLFFDLPVDHSDVPRSEEHTSELQSQSNLVCRLLLEKKKKENSQ